ncbi:MAG: rplR [Candidatus Taylorbacteria bacterium]|nr:rplR [Candidatus Taylorbacteria bacterium]
MKTSQIKQQKIARRHKRIRSTISGTAERPRLSVFKSHKFISAQLIDDVAGKTVAAFTSRDAKAKAPAEKAKEVGVEIAKKAKSLKIEKVVFDRGGYLYTGKIKAIADGAREGGLIF